MKKQIFLDPHIFMFVEKVVWAQTNILRMNMIKNVLVIAQKIIIS
jgi:hypothetical protein